MTSYIQDAASVPLPASQPRCLPRSLIASLHLQVNVKRGSSAPPQASFCLRRDAGTRGRWGRWRGGWFFDTCHFHSAAPCSLATRKDFLCHSLARYHEWARGLRNPITGRVSDSRHYGCCSHVARIRKDLLISSSSSSSSSFTLALSPFLFQFKASLAPSVSAICAPLIAFPSAAGCRSFL